MESYYRTQLESWLSAIDVDCGRVLDIGGGLNPVRGRTKSWRVGEYKILDNGLEGDFSPDFKLDLNTEGLPDLPLTEKIKRFSPQIIFCLELMEYIIDPLSVIRFIHSIMEDGGIAYISFPSIYPVHEPSEYDFLRYTRRGVSRLLEMSGFSGWKIESRIATKGKENLRSFYSSEKMKGLKNSDIIFDIGYLVMAHK